MGVTKKTGLKPSKYLEKYLYEKAGMKNTVVHPMDSPIISGFMTTTIDDYDSFLRKYISYEILPQDMVEEIEAYSGNRAPWFTNAMGIYRSGSCRFWGGSLWLQLIGPQKHTCLLHPP